MFKNYLKTAWRNIVHQPSVSVINIGSLAIAMTAVTMIAIWMQNELSFDTYHANADRIYLLKNNWQIDKSQTWKVENSFYPLADAIKSAIPEAEAVTKMNKIRKGELKLNVNENLFREDAGIYVDKNWFAVFKYDFIQGSAANFTANPHGIILTETKAKQLFGSINIIGSYVKIDSLLFTVSGIVKDNPINSSFQFDVILPFYNTEYLNEWLYLTTKTFIKLTREANVGLAEKKINAIIQTNSKADGSITTSLLSLKDMHFENDFKSSAFKHAEKKTVYIFGTLAFLLLLAAAVNYVNLSVARASSRVKEISIRKINGATRKHLFIQILSESMVTSCLALLLTVILLYVCFPLLKQFSDTHFIFNPLQPVTIAILTGILISILLLTGIYPALLISSFRPISFFSGSNVLGIKNSAFKKVLIIGQFALAVFMVIACIVVYWQMMFMQKQNISYNSAQVFTAQVPSNAFSLLEKGSVEKRESTLATIKQELLSSSEIKTVSRTDISSPVNENYTIANGVDWDGKGGNFEPEYISYAVDADMDSIMHFKIIQGRWFNKKNSTDKKNVVLNETAVRLFGLKKPVIGKRFNDGIIIGVVKDFFYKSMHEKIGAVVIRTGLPLVSTFIIQAKPGLANEALQSTKKTWKKYFPDGVFEYSFADEDFAALYKNDQKALIFTLIFSALSIFICCMGLFGMTVFMIARRTKEIGIRKILGATSASITALFSKDFLQLVIISILIASPVAWWVLNKWLQDYAYRIDIRWWMFVIAGILVIVITLITV
ncbi:MAG: ABC transporter permease, partial [Ferruginibacter sp.]